MLRINGVVPILSSWRLWLQRSKMHCPKLALALPSSHKEPLSTVHDKSTAMQKTCKHFKNNKKNSRFSTGYF